ncbi:hypothetical protein TRIP_C20626 [Candidatus Zixiibacteriota bacterium]|nr:hypothetical protein TRIP_C20626 [candidate division Zixibacteria bacterium]
MSLKSIRGFTLIELVMVIIIIGVLAGVAMKSMSSAIQTGRIESTKQEMEQLASAIVGNPDLVSNGSRTDFGYVGDVGSLPSNLDALVNQPTGFTTWKGPYIRNSFNQASEDFKRDAWNALYNFTGGVTIISSGSGSNITKQFANAAADLTGNTIQGVVLDGSGSPPGACNGDVTISITYPDGTGATATTTANPSANGNYSFSNIPIGIRTVKAINDPTHDTATTYVTVLPKSTIINNIKFGAAVWNGCNGASGNGLQYVAGSAHLENDGTYVRFDIYNDTGANVTIEWLKAEYSHTPNAYYSQVRWGGQTVANTNGQRYSSGTQVNFNSSRTINNGANITIELRYFVDKENGNGNVDDVNMAGTTFTITFSDNSVITFSV